VLPEKIHRYIFLFGVCGLGFGMMIGAVPTSVPQFVLLGNWLLEGDFKRKWNQLKTNKIFWALSSLFLIHLVGLLYSQDQQAAVADGRIKLPLLLLPLFLFTSKPLSLKEFYGVLYCFIAGSVVNTLWCLFYSFGLHHNEGVRDASRFMSHIRLGLYLNITIAACVYFAVKSESLVKKFGLILLSCYFIFVLYVLGLASGLMNFMILFLLVLGVTIYRRGTPIKVAALILVSGFITLVGNYVMDIKNAQLDVKSSKNNEPQNFSSSGRPYIHFEKEGQKENGNYIQINVQPEELQREWKKEFPTDSFDYGTKLNLERYVVLVRYLASKGLNKDSAGLARLNEEDKMNIQKGISNFEYPTWSYLHKRTYELVNEYDEFRNDRLINGHSLTMRLYFWKAALEVVKPNFLFGVGSGDVQLELNKVYGETKSPLDVEWYKRPHNQFLTVTVGLGIVGLFIFLVSFIYPARSLRNYLPKLYWPFLIVAIISFLLEDTLETQAGCTFYAFFTTLFMSVAWYRKESDSSLEKLSEKNVKFFLKL